MTIAEVLKNLDGIAESSKRVHGAIMNRIGDPNPDMILLENIAIDHLEYVERVVRAIRHSHEEETRG